MRILFIIDDYLPHSIKVGAKLMHELGVHYIRLGHQVSVVTPGVHLENDYEERIIDQVKVYFFQSGPVKNVSLIKRAINETLLSYKAWKALKEIFHNESYDLIVYYSPSIFWGGLVRKLKKKWNAKSFLILRDLFPQWVIDNGTLKQFSPITIFFKYFERRNYLAADTIGLQSPANLDWFERNHNNKIKKKTVVLYNWAQNNPAVPDGSFRRRFNLQNKVIFFYGGNIGKAQDMMNLVRLAKNMLPQENAFFIFLGEGDEVSKVKDSIEKWNLSNTLLLPSVNQEKFRQILSEIDIGLFSLDKNLKTHNFPGKLLGYMNESIPILGSVNPDNDLADLVHEHNAGFISINGDDDILFKNALALHSNKELRKNMGSNANNLLYEIFSVETAAKTILSHL